MTGKGNHPKKRVHPQKKIKKPSNSKSTSKPRAAGRPGVIQRRVVAFTRPKALPKRLPGSFQGFTSSAWAESVQHPFNDRGFKIPDLVSGPPSVLFCTTDLNNTQSGINWPLSTVAPTQSFTLTDGVLNVAQQSSINTTGQQLMVQFLPCVMSPASFLLSREEVEVAFAATSGGAGASGVTKSITKLVEFLAGMMENAADQITPVLGWWMVLDSSGYIKGVDLLRADKLMTAKESIKMLRMTKAGLKVTLQQPKFATGGQVYMNKGAGAYLPIFSVNDTNDDGVTSDRILERITTFRYGQRCILGASGESNTFATKANVVKLASQTAGTHVEALNGMW